MATHLPPEGMRHPRRVNWHAHVLLSPPLLRFFVYASVRLLPPFFDIKVMPDDFVNIDIRIYNSGHDKDHQTIMATTETRRTPKRSVAKTPTPAAPAADEREPRGARRKRETRARLLDAALRLMADRGMEGVAINEITEAADVGFGSFYNHFESKEAIYAALVSAVFEEFADSLDKLTEGLSDAAEIISVSVRHTLVRARREPVWGRFLIREGFSARVLTHGLGQRLLRDIERGIAAKRFVVADPFIGFLSVGGTVLTAVSAELNFLAPDAPAANIVKELGFSGEHFPERTAAALLQTLGLKRAEAEKVAARPLPVVETADSAS